MKTSRSFLWLAVWTVAAVAAMPIFSGTIVGSKHDLTHVIPAFFIHSSTMNNYGEVCVYCHAPHGATTAIDAPLWNHRTPSQPYTLYSSSTLDSIPGQPGGYSLACLSCHDGTIGVDEIINAPGSGDNLGGPWYGNSAVAVHWKMNPDPFSGATCAMCHDGSTGHYALMGYLGTDLRNDHPIGMTYPTPAQDPDFSAPDNPQSGWGGASSHDVKLYGGKIECPSCHNVHDPDTIPFLRKSNQNSALCTTCHIK
ncbi:MAG: hypothetical protein HYX75_19760 [Acidobacteria bacterium]|nr:hypothetical protein [Acidobacteriota bacterium]